MTGLEIGLLIIGIAFFVGSFFFTEKLSSSDLEAIEKLSEKEIAVLLEKQMRSASDRIERTIDEKLVMSISSAERQITKTANEQILSISDHADEVREVLARDMEAANKSHDEIVFMHTMLNEKQKKVTDIEKEAQLLESHIRALKHGIEEELFAKAHEAGLPINKIAEEAEAIAWAQIEAADLITPEDNAADIVADAKSLKEAAAVEVTEPADAETAEETADTAENVNEKILRLHREGYSEMEIAKQLDKGLPEIKLVLGLFGEEE
ncbi:MAG: hypothetical protein IJT32_02655 [Lachnospiraceae bacterium]|nr:hypothetical protein [Lachnospiraceae bacterium]